MFELNYYYLIPQSVKPIFPVDQLPEFDALEPFDADGKRLVVACLRIGDGNNADHMKRGTEVLTELQEELDGSVFNFKIIDRHILDPRIR